MRGSDTITPTLVRPVSIEPSWIAPSVGVSGFFFFFFFFCKQWIWGFGAAPLPLAAFGARSTRQNDSIGELCHVEKCQSAQQNFFFSFRLSRNPGTPRYEIGTITNTGARIAGMMESAHDANAVDAGNTLPQRKKSTALRALRQKTRKVFGRYHGNNRAGYNAAENSLAPQHEDALLTDLVHGSESLLSRLAHPRAALKDSVAGIVSGKLSHLNNPDITIAAEEEYVAVHDSLDEAVRRGDDGDVEDAKRAIEQLKIKRRNMRVRWALSRHVNRVTITPVRWTEWPSESDFLVRDEHGNVVRDEDGIEVVDYARWLGHVCSSLSPCHGPYIVFCS
jgi:hypothetical protein